MRARVLWRRRRELSWWWLGPAAVLAVGAVLLKEWKGPSWALLLVGVVLAVGAVWVPLIKAKGKERDEHDALLQRSTAVVVGGRLPLVRDVPLHQLGVHAAHVDVPYLARDKEGELVEALAAQGAVLVVGHSMAGKTRMCAQVVRRCYPDRQLWVPSVPSGVAELINGGGLPPRGAVVWLNDIERYLAPEHLKVEWLERMREQDNVVLATLRASEYESFQPTGQLRPPQAEILERLTPVWLEDDDDERVRHAAAVSDANQARSIARYGVAEYAGGGYLAIERFRSGQSQHPLGVALVRAAADWRRAGLEVIPEATLIGLASQYLARRYQHDPKEDDQQALAWATTPIGDTLRLIEPAGKETWRAFDYIVDHADAQKWPIPDQTWREVGAAAGTEEAMQVAYRAHETGARDIAVHLWRQVAGHGGPQQVAGAAINIGIVLSELGDLTGAREAFQQAIDTGHPDRALVAAYGLATLLRQHTDLSGAQQAYQTVIDSGHREYAPSAGLDLGDLLFEQGDAKGAEHAYRRVIDTGHSEHAAHAQLNLGSMLQHVGDPLRAREEYQSAAASGHTDYGPMARFLLGNLLLRNSGLGDAAETYREVIATRHPDWAPQALNSLGTVLGDRGAFPEAEEKFREAIDTGHPDAAPRAQASLGNLLRLLGDEPGARRASRNAIKTGHFDAAPHALLTLGNSLDESGDLAGAEDAYRRAIKSGHRDHAPAAAANLGLVLTQRGDQDGAHRAYRSAMNSEHPDAAPHAALNLGNLLATSDDLMGARQAYRFAIDSGHPDVAMLAQRAYDELPT